MISLLARALRAVRPRLFVFLGATTLALPCLTAAVPREARASVAVAITYERLVASSTAVAVTTPLERRSTWEGGRIYTYTRLRVDRAIAGETTADGSVWVRTMGGEVGGIGQLVEGEPSFVVGRPTLVFLRAARPAGGGGDGLFVVSARAQGQYSLRVDRQSVARLERSHDAGGLVLPPELAGRSLAGAETARVRRPSALAADVLDRMELGEACLELAATFAELHRVPLAR